MRRQRQVNRVMAEMISPESWFEDWRWNLNDDSACLRRRHVSDPTRETPEEIFSDWRRISLGNSTSSGHQDAFAEWMKNLKHRVDKKRRTNPKRQGNTNLQVIHFL
jgi:hypothetical protein